MSPAASLSESAAATTVTVILSLLVMLSMLSSATASNNATYAETLVSPKILHSNMHTPTSLI